MKRVNECFRRSVSRPKRGMHGYTIQISIANMPTAAFSSMEGQESYRKALRPLLQTATRTSEYITTGVYGSAAGWGDFARD